MTLARSGNFSTVLPVSVCTQACGQTLTEGWLSLYRFDHGEVHYPGGDLSSVELSTLGDLIMKRMMVAAIGLLPIAAVSLLPQAASAQVVLRGSIVTPWSVAVDQQYDNDRRDGWRDRDLDRRDDWRDRDLDRRDNDNRHNGDRYNGDRRDGRDGSYRRDADRREQQRRVWIPGHWEPGFLGLGRKWVEGHYAQR